MSMGTWIYIVGRLVGEYMLVSLRTRNLRMKWQIESSGLHFVVIIIWSHKSTMMSPCWFMLTLLEENINLKFWFWIFGKVDMLGVG